MSVAKDPFQLSRTGQPTKSGTPRLHADEILYIASSLPSTDLARLTAASRFFRHTVLSSPSLFRRIDCDMRGNARQRRNDDEVQRPESLRRRLSFETALAQLKWSLLASQGANVQQEVSLDVLRLTHQQCEVLVEALRPYAANLHLLSVDSIESVDIESIVMEFALYELPALKHLRMVDYDFTTALPFSTFGLYGPEVNQPRDSKYWKVLPASHPRLKSLCHHTGDWGQWRFEHAMAPLLASLADIDIACSRGHGARASMLRDILRGSQDVVRRLFFRMYLGFSRREQLATWEHLDVPKLTALHIEKMGSNGVEWIVQQTCSFFGALSMPKLAVLSLHDMPHSVMGLINAPALRTLSFSPDSQRCTEYAGLGSSIARFACLQTLEIRTSEGRRPLGPMFHFIKTFVHDALPGLSTASPSDLTPGHSVALPLLHSLSFIGFEGRSQSRDDDDDAFDDEGKSLSHAQYEDVTLSVRPLLLLRGQFRLSLQAGVTIPGLLPHEEHEGSTAYRTFRTLLIPEDWEEEVWRGLSEDFGASGRQIDVCFNDRGKVWDDSDPPILTRRPSG